MNDSIRYEKRDGVATVTKIDARYNQGMTRGVIVGLHKAIEDARDDKDIRVVVITAANNGFHEGGRWVDELRPDWKYSPMEFRDVVQYGHAVLRMLETLEKPVIGVAKGGARGGGLEMLHACDFVIAAEDAEFSQSEAEFGMVPGWGGTQRLPRLVGWRRAKELLLCADYIKGKEAAEMGLVTKAVPADRVDAEVAALIARLMKPAPLAQGFIKLAMNKVWETHIGAGLDYETEASAILISYQEFPTYMKAVTVGREPEFARHQRLTVGPEWK